MGDDDMDRSGVTARTRRMVLVSIKFPSPSVSFCLAHTHTDTHTVGTMLFHPLSLTHILCSVIIKSAVSVANLCTF